MKCKAGFRVFLLALVGGTLMLADFPDKAVCAQGLGDFSAPAPQSVPKALPPARKPKPSRGPQRPAMRHEELVWFSRRMLCQGTSQDCEESASWPVQTEFDDVYFLTLSVPDSYCSPVYLSVELDGIRLGSTGLLGPGRSEVLTLGRLSAGDHLLRVSARGREGGCNRGVLQSWGVDLILSNKPARKTSAESLAPLS